MMMTSSSSSSDAGTDILLLDDEKTVPEFLLIDHDQVRDKINQSFNSLISLVEQRRQVLLTELKSRSTTAIEDLTFKENQTAWTNMTSLIRTYGRLASRKEEDAELSDDSASTTLSSSSSLIQNMFKITGRGLKQCVVNEEAMFSLLLKDQETDLANRVSLLDIFIINEDPPLPAHLMPTAASANRAKLTHEHTIKTVTKSVTKSVAKCNCDCKLECVGDGMYEVKYKLDKKGTYSLNVLVNKKHINGSPFKLTCLENTVIRKQQPHYDHSISNLTSLNEQPPRRSVSKLPVKSQSSFNLKTSSSATLNRSLTPRVTEKRVTIQQKSPTIHRISQTKPNKPKSSAYNLVPPPPPASKSSLSKASNLKQSKSMNDSLRSSAHSILSDSLASPASSSTSSTCTEAPAPLSPTASAHVSSGNNLESFNDLTQKEDDFLFQIGRHGRNQSEFLNPQAVCATNDYIFVTDSNNQKVEAFAHNGEYKFSLGWSSVNSRPNQLRRPIGIDSKSDGKILVVDYELKCVNVYEENGCFLNRICNHTTPASRLLGPKGISINKVYHDQIVIADSKANAVYIFDSEGRFVSKFGNLGPKNENFAGPQYVSCNSVGDIVVTDFYNHCIKVFDCTGKFKFSFGTKGADQGQFSGPTGVATDARDNIIVVDWGNSRIQVFDKHGNFKRFINTEMKSLYGPQDVAVINNTVAVADSGNHCIKLFEYI